MKLSLPRVAFSILLILVISLNFAVIEIPYVSAQPTWPQQWIEIDWDRNENGAADDWRDVEYAYYQYDNNYLYLKLQCYDIPGKKWPNRDGRYKWFIDLDGNMYYSGGNIIDAEYVLFVEDTDHNAFGEMYLLFDANNDNNFDEYEPWPPTNYVNYETTDPNIGGWRIVAPNQIEMYMNWISVGNPASYKLFWSTDQQNPNVDQSPTADRIDEEQPIIVHNVAAISQVPTPQIVRQGEHVQIQVDIENKGTQTETFNVTCYFNNTVIGTKIAANLAAGQQMPLSFDWDTTGIPVGNYRITSWADSSAAIAETDEQDNWCTSPAIVTVQSAPVHDVAAMSQVPDKTSVVQGTMVNINVTLSNLGDFNETFNVTCFYSDNPISYQTVTDLVQKTSTSIIFAWDTTGVEPNTYYIIAMADSSDIIAEINEDNNNCTSFEAVTVYSPSQMGKLFVDKVKTTVISGEDPPVVGLQTVYELTIIVTNIGGSAVSNIILNETISSDVTFVSVGTPSQGSVIALPPPRIVWNIGTLTPGANATLTIRISATPTSPNLLYLNHKEDVTVSGKDTLSGNPVSDSGDIDITVTAVIRDVAAISQVPTSTVVCQGDTVTIDVTVRNLGNVSETFDVTCYYNSNPIDVIRVYNLAAGGQNIISFAWDTIGIPPETYSISAEADSSHEITESNETNNICTFPSVVKIVIHDVAIISQLPSPTTVMQGENVTIEVVVKNEGTEPETFTVSCYYNNTLLEIKTVTDLQPNTTETLNFIWNTTSVPEGVYFINTGASTVLGEKDTDDNACLSTTNVRVSLLQYYLTVSSPYGIPSGEGWYDNGNTAYATLDIDTIDHGNGTRKIFTSWGGDASGTDYAQSNPILIDGSKTATANWKTQHYLTLTTSSGGVTNPSSSNWYEAETIVSVTAIPDTYYLFGHWELDSTDIGSANPHNVTMDTAHTLHAVFVREMSTLTISTTTGGTTDPSPGEHVYPRGTNVQVTAIPDENYAFDHWELDGLDFGSANPATVFLNPNHGLHAVFVYSPPSQPIIGGSTVSINSPLLHTWVSLNAVLIAAIFATASWIKRWRRKTS